MTHSTHKEPRLILLGQAIRSARERKGMRVDDLAKASNSPRERIDALEAGKLDPTYEQLVEIAEALGIQPSALVLLAERLGASSD